jgi:ATP-dependent DNA helicase RecG
MDHEVLRLAERVEIARQIGESHFREFKSAYEGPPNEKKPRDPKSVSKDIAETLVAFANADGGELIVGIEDDGSVTGLGYSEERIQGLIEAPKSRVHKDTPLPSVRAIPLPYQGHVVLYFSVPKGTTYVYLTSDGRCLQRRDLESVPIASEQIKFSRDEVASREYDRQFVDHADIDDLDIRLLSGVAEQISKGMSVEKCLQHLDIAEFDGSCLRLRKAALLLFAADARKWHPRLQVRILRINGTELRSAPHYNVTKDETVEGNVIQLLSDSWDQLRPHLAETRFSGKALFKTQIIYPELACREALINAIAHRDYNLEGQGIEVHVFDDRLQIVSPGPLLSSISIADLRERKGVHQSRNSLLARVLRELGYMRELGEGMRRIYELMVSSDLTPPVLESGRGTFRIALHHRLAYSPEEKLWLDNFESLDLSRSQKTVVRLGCNGREISPDQIFDAVGIVDTDDYRKLIASLYELGILQRTVAKGQRQALAKKKHVPAKKFPQFIVQLPKKIQGIAPTPDPDSDDEIEYAKVFAANLPFNTNEEEVAEAFSACGEVVNVQLPVNRETGLRRGFAFVEFATCDQADSAISQSGNITIRGRRIYVQAYEPHPPKEGSPS